jgi:hypothetical protein
MAEGKKSGGGSLKDEDIVTEKDVGRRELVGLLGVGAAGAVALVSGCGGRRTRVVEVQTVSTTGYTDGDSSYGCTDSPGYGRGPQIAGVTDGDQGNCGDPANYGRRGGGQQQVIIQQQASGCSDSDPHDPVGTDGDVGYGADAVGQGRRCY